LHDGPNGSSVRHANCTLQAFYQEVAMNKDQLKGHLKDLAGKAQQKLGEMTGSKEQQAKGMMKQAEGKAQKGVGDVKNIARSGKEENKPR
jgi:uncharacterized protein YjbJ (UPF0337 family)